MLNDRDRRIVTELQDKLAAVTEILDLRVFGSRARGDATPESDLDVFLIVDHCSPSIRRHMAEIAWEVGFAYGSVVSLIVATQEDIDDGPMGANPLYLNVQREGVRL